MINREIKICAICDVGNKKINNNISKSLKSTKPKNSRSIFMMIQFQKEKEERNAIGARL
jgi:hypothetical protein